MSDKVIKITNAPAGAWRDRVLHMANAAKHAAWASGSPIPPDDVLIRAAMAVDLLITLSNGPGIDGSGGQPADLAVVLTAAQFMPTESDESRERVELLSVPLDDPWRELAAACATNRRLLGLDVEGADQ